MYGDTAKEKIDPLGAKNLLIILTGPTTGYIPGGRICASGKAERPSYILVSDG